MVTMSWGRRFSDLKRSPDWVLQIFRTRGSIYVYLCFWVRGLASLPEVSWLFASQIGVFHCKSAGNASNYFELLEIGCPKTSQNRWLPKQFPSMGGTPKSSIFVGFSLINHPFRSLRKPTDTATTMPPWGATPLCWLAFRCDGPTDWPFYGETLDIKMMVI